MKMSKCDGALLPTTVEDGVLFSEYGENVIWECTPIDAKKRSGAQNRAMHKYFELLAKALNDAGYTMEVVLKHHPNIRWTKESIKGHLWKPVQAGMTEDKENDTSTKDLTTVTTNEVYTELQNFISSTYGINVEWPSGR